MKMSNWSNDPKWRKFMDQKWRETNQSNKESAYDVINETYADNYTTDVSSLIKSVGETKKDLNKLKVRELKRESAYQKHGKKYVQDIAQNKNNIRTKGARRKQIASKPNPTPEEALEHLRLSNEIEKEMNSRIKDMNKDFENG